MTERGWRPINLFEIEKKSLSLDDELAVKTITKYLTIISLLAYFVTMLVFVPYG